MEEIGLLKRKMRRLMKISSRVLQRNSQFSGNSYGVLLADDSKLERSFVELFFHRE